MKSSLKCEVVRDLFPSYIDDLTNVVTNEEIENHIVSCSECLNILEKMKAPVETSTEVTELDYLKKIKHRTHRNILLGIMITTAFFLLVLFLRYYVIGFQGKGVADYSLQFSPIYSDNDTGEDQFCLVINGQIESRSMSFINYQIKEEGDTATISFTNRLAFPWEQNDTFYVGYEIPDSIKTIYLYHNIIYENGVLISKDVNALYKTRHLYIGDMSANGRTAYALGIVNKFGGFTNSLQTSAEPYEWTMEFQNTVTDEETYNNYMTRYSYMLLSIIENLSKVSWEYNNGSEVLHKTVTLQDADTAMGQDIKSYSTSISQMQTLANKLYLY